MLQNNWSKILFRGGIYFTQLRIIHLQSKLIYKEQTFKTIRCLAIIKADLAEELPTARECPHSGHWNWFFWNWFFMSVFFFSFLSRRAILQIYASYARPRIPTWRPTTMSRTANFAGIPKKELIAEKHALIGVCCHSMRMKTRVTTWGTARATCVTLAR